MEDKSSKIPKKEIIVRIACVIIAFILWLVNYNNINPVNKKEVVAVKVSIKNQEVLTDSNLSLSDSAKILTVNFQIKSRDTNPDLTPSSYAAEIDLKGQKLKAGKNNIEYTVTKKPNDVEVILTENNKFVSLVLDELYRVKKEVSVFRTGNPKPGYYYLGCKFNGEPTYTVTLSGPQDSVDKIDKVGFSLELSNQEKNIALLPEFALYTANDTLYLGNDITISPEKVDVVAIIAKVKEVPIVISEKGTQPEDIQIDSKTTDPMKVEIVGDGDVFERITEINTEPIDLAKVSEINYVKLVIPDQLSVINKGVLTNNMTVKATYEISKITNKTLNLTPKPINLDPSLSTVTNLSTIKIDVILKGKESILNTLNETNVNANLDLIYLNEGTHQVPVKVNLPDGVNTNDVTIVSTSPNTVEVVLTKN